MSDTSSSYDPKFTSKFLIGYLYFIQGIAIALCITIPLTYKTLPSYQILGIFSAATLPFSFKFITAPLIQKYSILSYGRRKFWIVLSMSVAASVLYMISQIVQNQQKQSQTAYLLFIVGFCISAQDISTDALAVKQLRKPQLSSFLQSVFQQLGVVIGSLILGEMTSDRFGAFLGYGKAIVSPSDLIFVIMALILIPTLLIHFFFQQTSSQKQQTIRRLSLWQVISHYKHFILPRYRVCRQTILFILMFQGTNFFTAGYSIQMINSGVLSKQFIVSLGNLSLIVIFPATYLMSRFITVKNLAKAEQVLYTLRVFMIAVIFFTDIRSQVFATIALLMLQLAASLHFYLNGIVMNSFEDSKFQGMSVTMMASMSNLGRNQTLHLNLIGKFGFNSCVLYSLGYSFLFTAILKPVHNWIQKGQEEQGQTTNPSHPHSD